LPDAQLIDNPILKLHNDRALYCLGRPQAFSGNVQMERGCATTVVVPLPFTSAPFEPGRLSLQELLPCHPSMASQPDTGATIFEH
jgi:hypothetical protein